MLGLFSSELRTLETEEARSKEALRALGQPIVGQTVPEFGVQHIMVLQPPPVPPWVQVDLGTNQTIDLVAVVPALVDFEPVNRSAYAFPRRFRIDASDDETFATFAPLFVQTDSDYTQTGMAPLVVPTPGAKARFIRFTVTKLSEVEGRWTYALGELIALNGNRNVALGKKVNAVGTTTLPPRWRPTNLTDGRTPLGPPIKREPAAWDGLFTAPRTNDLVPAWMAVDLGEPRNLQEVRLHPVHSRQGADVPGYSFPLQFRIEASENESFAEATTVFDTGEVDFANPGNNPVTFQAEGIHARHVRVLMTKESPGRRGSFGLSELEVFADGTNAALGRAVSFTGDPTIRPPSMLVDGYTSYGPLQDLPVWLGEWAERGRLESRIVQLANQRNGLEAVAGRRAVWSGGAVALALVGGLGAMVLAARRRRQRELENLRIRLAQDLHDEIGSNLAGIARLSEVASGGSPSEAAHDLAEVGRIARASSDALREVLWLVGARQQGDIDFIAGLRQVAGRMLAGRAVVWAECPDTLPDSWPTDARRQLFLFFKEVLANIVRHSEAGRVELSFAAAPGLLRLKVMDDGKGFDPKSTVPGAGLQSLKRRARDLGGALVIDSSPGRGTRIELEIPIAPGD